MKEFKSKPLIGLDDLSDEKYSIAKLARIDSINENRNIESCKLGGRISGNNRVKTKTGIVSLSKEERKKYGLLGALAQSKEDKAIGGRIAGKLRKDKGNIILMIDKETNNILKEFPSIATAARFLDRNKTAENKIRRVANGDRKSSYGYIWKYKK